MSQLEILSKDVFLIRDFVSVDACTHWIEQAEREGFSSAPVTTGTGPVLMPDVRNNTRVMRDDVALGDLLWGHLAPILPDAWSVVPWRHGTTLQACGLNERLRFYRYEPGERFATHRDGNFIREDGSGEHSQLTALLYLNEGFEGGETRILEPGQAFEIKPEQGMLLCFAHRLLHEGATLISGRKYVLRTDVMYHLMPG